MQIEKQKWQHPIKYFRILFINNHKCIGYLQENNQFLLKYRNFSINMKVEKKLRAFLLSWSFRVSANSVHMTLCIEYDSTIEKSQ